MASLTMRLTVVVTLAIGCAMAGDIYEECHQNAALCFGMPNGCIQQNNCKALFKSTSKTNKFTFELIHTKIQQNHYVAIAFSNQTQMTGMVVQCHYSSKQSKSIISYSFNYGMGKNTFITNNTDVNGFTIIQSSFQDGQLSCKFESEASGLIQYQQNSLNLETDHYYLQLASGPMVKDNQLGYHQTSRLSSAEKFSLKQTGNVGGAGMPSAIKLHASLMIFGWIGCITPAILMARHARGQWKNHKWFGLQIWFVLHRVLMVTGWLSMVASYIIIFVHSKGWVGTSYHTVAGLVAGILATLQILNSFLRPSPDSKNRWIFNYIHWCMGNLAHILALSNIVLFGMAQSEKFFSLLLSYLFIYLIFTDLLKKLDQTVQQKGNSISRRVFSNITILAILTILAIALGLIGIFIQQ